MTPRHYQSDVIVAGGGLAGIVAALELLDRGRHVLVLDRDIAGNLGGLAKKSFGGGGIHGRGSLEGTFLGSCVLTGRMAGRSIAGEG
jgi:predicted oxidoreductase